MPDLGGRDFTADRRVKFVGDVTTSTVDRSAYTSAASEPW
jgi:hypothetical protein